MSKSLEKRQNESLENSEEIDTDDVLYRDRQKEKFNSNKWTQGILEDVKMCRSIVFKKKRRDSDSNKFYAVETFTADDNPEDAFDKSKPQEDSELHIRSEWRKKSKFSSDGSFKKDGQIYEYQEKIRPVAVVSSSEENGYKKHIEIRKLTQKPVETFNKLANYVGRTVLIGNSRLSGMMLRTEGIDMKGKEVTFTSRSKYMTGGMSATFVAGIFLSMSVATGFDPFFPLTILGIFTVVILGFFTTIKIAYGQTESLFDGKDPNWLYEIPDEAVVRQVKSEGQMYSDFEMKETDVTTYDNGTVKIDYQDAEWVFKGNIDGTPNEDVNELFDDYGLDIVDNTKKFAIAKDSDVIMPSGMEYYMSEDDSYVLMTKKQYRKLKRSY